jgi:MraZ protein
VEQSDEKWSKNTAKPKISKKEEAAMLSGEFKHNLDTKNRIFMPSKMREELGESFVIAKSLREKCLVVYSLDEWNKYMSPINDQNRKLQERAKRFLNATAAEVTPDSQGRIVLPKHLIDYAQITRALTIVGCFNYAEIWSDELYDLCKEEDDFESMVAELESLGL